MIAPDSHHRPPRAAVWLIRFITPRPDREVVLGDLHEEYQRQLLAGAAPSSARRWYWLQAIGSIGPNIRRNLGVSAAFSPLTLGGIQMLATISHDIRYAIRILIKQPVYSLTAIGMLTLGIAGNTAMFSVFNGLFLRPLPFPSPDRLVNLDETAPRWNLEFVAVNYQDFANWRENNTTFDAMAVFDQDDFNLATEDEPARVTAELVSHDLARVLGIEPVLGRHFTLEEDTPGGGRVVQLGYATWLGRFAGDSAVIGRSVTLDGEPYTIVGVLPREAEFIEEADLWLPLAADISENTGSWWLTGIGRLKPGVTIEQAVADLTRIHKNAIEERPANETTSPVVLPVLERVLGEYRFGASVILGAVGLVLVIACANIAGLMLARYLTRGREIAIRISLGASRRRVVQQLLTESLVLSVVGAAAGTVLGVAGASALRAITAEVLPAWVSFALDLRVLAFAIAVTVGAAIAFGLAPALSAARSNAAGTLHTTTTRASASRARRRALDLLVVAEVALSLVLLAAAGLSVRDFLELRNTDPGFRPENVLMYRIALPTATYEDAEQRIAFFDEHLSRIRALPGVAAAGAATNPPLSYHTGWFFEIEDAPPDDPDAPRPVTLVRTVTDGYLEAMGVTLLSGRSFRRDDGRDDGSSVVIVNETFARRYWPDSDPIGRRIRTGSESDWLTVIGVTRDVKHYGLATEMRQGIYWPYPLQPRSDLAIVIRSSVDPQSLVSPARQVLRDMDSTLPMAEVTTMSQELEESLWARRAASWLSAIFSLVALALAVGGIYGVVSYTVNQRTREIGIRMALGARPGQVVGGVLRHGATMIAMGVALGLAGAWGAGRLMSSMLVDVSGLDPLVFGSVTAVIVGVTAAANLLPARRASSVEPSAVLREE
jgi:predicted permease